MTGSAEAYLSAASLDLVEPGIPVPDYLGGSARIGMVHIGVGNFHRSHQAMYADRLLSADAATPWAICGIGTRDADRDLVTALQRQDGLYSLSLFGGDGSVATRVIGSIREVVLSVDDPRTALDRLSHPDVRVVSLTITESGYIEDPSAGRRASDDEALQADLADGLRAPRSAFGLIVAALRARRASEIAPFTVMSCDNIQANGTIARASVIAAARLVDEELAEWIGLEVGFPSTMVDRITPQPTPAQAQAVRRMLGLRDDAIVVAEPFTQWILEDDFRSGRPAWEAVGAVFAENIGAYEAMKLRLLNGAHQVLAYVGSLRGHALAHEAMRDDVVRGWLEAYWRSLALPDLDLPVGVDGDGYVRSLVERFSNPAIADTLERLASDSSARMATFVLPVLVDARDRHGFADLAGVLLASWAASVGASTSSAVTTGVSARLLSAMRDADPCAFLAATDWLAPLADDERLRASVSRTRDAFASLGAAEALERLLSSRR
ncbi:mannitol dehydrogenase family protein [Microbacterium sp. NPDC058342]|uniref:mannitol dehydrogenase family protein n=1 Tax=Microbacterium sp. NPDC058342 TaxID=3346454 RepID=UPI003646B01E